MVEEVEKRLLGETKVAPFRVFDGVTLHKVSSTCAGSARVGMAVGHSPNEGVVLLGRPIDFDGDIVYGYVISVDRDACEIQVKRK